MQLESVYCRRPLAASFNQLPGHCWVSNPNVTYTQGGHFEKGEAYESGRPDAFVFRINKPPICVECKASRTPFFMGDPSIEKSKGLSRAQRNWHNKVALSTQTPYYIAVHIHQEEPTDGTLFLVPYKVYIATESLLLHTTGFNLLPLHRDKTKHVSINATDEWDQYKLNKHSRVYTIPLHRL